MNKIKCYKLKQIQFKNILRKQKKKSIQINSIQ
jgi:hypothetical protein